MANTFFDSLNAFLSLKQRRLFTASVQATYFAILTEFYQQGFPEEITMTVRELGAKAGLKSSESVHVAKNILKNNGLIDFQTVGRQARRTIFTLVCPNVCTNNLPNNPPNNLPNSESGGGLVCYTPAQVQGGESDGPLPLLPPTPPNNPNPELQPQQSKAKLSNAEQSNAGAEVDIVKVWEELTGKPLTDPANQFMLRRADDMHGREMVKVAIEEHVRCKGKNFSYFEAVLKSLAGRLASLKGGEENGTRVGKQSGANRPSVRTTAAGGTASDYSNTQASGKGRYDDDEPDYSWFYEEVRRIDEERAKATAGSDDDNANAATRDGRTP